MKHAPRIKPRSETWNDHSTGWLEGRRQQLWRKHSDAVNARLISDWLPRGRVRRVLKTDLFDEAVTEGLHALLESRAETVIGLDVSTRVLSAASRRHRALLCLAADVRSLPIEGASIDAVVSLSTLDHFESLAGLEEALTELRRILVPRGTLLLTLDNLTNPVIAVRNALPFKVTHSVGLVPYPVGKTQGPTRIHRLVEEAGFDVDECTAIMHAPRLLAIPVLGLLARLTRGAFPSVVARALLGFEHLRAVPTRFLTGHFIAVRATKA
ncbi:MAG: class I SAM-dependent methyltransferase [Gemmatimonadales bacterium]